MLNFYSFCVRCVAKSSSSPSNQYVRNYELSNPFGFAIVYEMHDIKRIIQVSPFLDINLDCLLKCIYGIGLVNQTYWKA